MPIIKTQNETPQIPVIHYNKTIHALLFILICVVIAGGVVFYQLSKVSIPEPLISQQEEQPPITPQQRNQALVEVEVCVTGRRVLRESRHRPRHVITELTQNLHLFPRGRVIQPPP